VFRLDPKVNALERFTTRQGLAENYVSAIGRDGRGAMWFATVASSASPQAGGFSRLEGKSFVNFTLADGLIINRISALHFDARGGLWAGTPAGLLHYDAESMTRFDERDGLDAGAVWSIASTSDGNVWFQVGDTAGKLSRFDGQRLWKVTREDGLQGTGVSCLYVDRDGALLIGGARSPVGKYIPGAGRSDRLRIETLDNSGPVASLARSTSGQLWHSTTRLGAAAGQSAGSGKSLGPGRLAQPASDGTVWFVADDGSIGRHDGTKLTRFAFTNGLETGAVRAG
jgi:ligand-binding sensor domain-containing protein